MDQHPDFKRILLTRHGANETICVTIYRRTGEKFRAEETFCNGIDEAVRLIESSYQSIDVGAIWTNIQRLKKGATARRKAEIEAYTNLTVDVDRRWKKLHADGTICRHGKNETCDAWKCNATDAEVAVLREVQEKIAALLSPAFGLCTIAYSGNGFHLNWKLADIEPVEGAHLYRRLLEYLKAKFETPDTNVEIDASLADATQVVTVWGTWNRKYPSTPDRPHRQSAVLFFPPKQKPIQDYDLSIWLDDNKIASGPHEVVSAASNQDRSKVDEKWLEEYGVEDLVEFFKDFISYEETSYDKHDEIHHPIAPCPCHEGEELHEHSHSRDCEIIEFPDGGIGISCFSGDLSLKQVIKKLNALKGDKYPHLIFAEESDEEIAKAFGVKDVREVLTPEPAKQPEKEKPKGGWGDPGWKPKKNPLPVGEKTMQARMRERERERIAEENWGGPCKGGCGKYNQGQYYCVECQKAREDAAFALQPGETELYRAEIAEKVHKQIVVREADSYELDNVEWLWHNKIPTGAITWCMGQPNNGKSLMTISIVASVTTGRKFPDGAENNTPPSKVLMYCGEDSPGKVVLPRLKAMGADTSKVSFFDRKSFRTYAGENEPEKRPLNLVQDLDELIEFAKQHPEYRMIVVDPITGIFGDKNINKNEEVNGVLEHLIDFCEVTGIAFLGVLHVPKRTTNSSIEKIAGGTAVGGSAKSAFMLSRDPDSDDIHDHMLAMVKWNYAENANGLKYKTVGATVDWKGKQIKTAKIEWGEVITDVADDVLVKQNSKKDDRDRQQDKCDAFLRTYLANGAQRSKDAYDAGEAQGFGESTVKRSVTNIGAHHIDGRKFGKKNWYMSLDPHPFEELAAVEERVMSVGAEAEL